MNDEQAVENIKSFIAELGIENLGLRRTAARITDGLHPFTLSAGNKDVVVILRALIGQEVYVNSILWSWQGAIRVVREKLA